MANWQIKPGKLRQISAKGSNVVGVAHDQTIWQWSPQMNNWNKLPGAAVHASAAADGSIWVCNAAQEIFRWNFGSWEKMPGACTQIDALTRDHAVCANSQQQLWEWTNGAWRQLPGAGTHITIGAGGEKWVVNSQHQIWRMPPGHGQWHQVQGALCSIHATDANNVVGAASDRTLWRWNGNGWNQLPGAGTHIAITHGNLWVVNDGHDIYHSFA